MFYCDLQFKWLTSSGFFVNQWMGDQENIRYEIHIFDYIVLLWTAITDKKLTTNDSGN